EPESIRQRIGQRPFCPFRKLRLVDVEPAGSRLVVGPNEERDVVARVALSLAHPISPDLLDVRQAPFDSAPHVLRRRGKRRGWDLGGNYRRQKGETATQQERSPRIHH